ncbi:dimethylmenaquinone methyltransferase [Streptomyces sp. GbtcB6]|uniref:RraA family protein n=1 Tax=Streptomyces sp. GbtcB6 TaxID=2824751 RepID=UPI001C30408B|nr:dimethylmenaquinone methyltransferase [Streptomyces sp. GbtcB6]
MPPLTAETRAQLADAGTATIANVLLRHGLRNTVLLGLRPVASAQPRLVGPAYTLRFIPAREDIDSLTGYADDDHLHRRAIEECPPEHVLVIDAGRNATAASAGDLMIARLMARGVAGVVTDGGFRDAPAIRRTGMPAYQQRSAPPATPIALHPVELNGPVGCAGVAVYPHDVIVGDGEGVVVVPAHLAAEVAAEAAEATAYEEFVEHEVARGRPLFGLFPATEASRSEYRTWLAAQRP